MAINWEDKEQAALFAWAAVMEKQYPELGLMFAIPNGGKRPPRTAAKMKATGVKAGVPDIFLPVPRGMYFGFFVELKAIYPDGREGRVSDKQEAWVEALRARGYKVEVIAGWQNAADQIESYLRLWV